MIKSFKDNYRWLSNFEPVKIVYEGIEYSSVEHAYMSAKSDDMEWKSKCADKQIPAKKIKADSKNIILKSDWEEIKINVMRECINQKFSQEPFKTKLDNTGDVLIEEGNWWNDLFWGVDIKTGEGENNLGKLIMDKRLKNRKNG